MSGNSLSQGSYGGGQVNCGRLQARVDTLEASTGGGDSGSSSSSTGRRLRPSGGKSHWLNTRAVASAALLLTTIAGAQGPLIQAGKITSLLCLIRRDD